MGAHNPPTFPAGALCGELSPAADEFPEGCPSKMDTPNTKGAARDRQ
jgi:hypothetical protein